MGMPRRLACWSPRGVRNWESAVPADSIQSQMGNGRPSSGKRSMASMLAVIMARTESAVLGLAGSTMDCATVPSIAWGLGERVELGL